MPCRSRSSISEVGRSFLCARENYKLQLVAAAPHCQMSHFWIFKKMQNNLRHKLCCVLYICIVSSKVLKNVCPAQKILRQSYSYSASCNCTIYACIGLYMTPPVDARWCVGDKPASWARKYSRFDRKTRHVRQPLVHAEMKGDDCTETFVLASPGRGTEKSLVLAAVISAVVSRQRDNGRGRIPLTPSQPSIGHSRSRRWSNQETTQWIKSRSSLMRCENELIWLLIIIYTVAIHAIDYLGPATFGVGWTGFVCYDKLAFSDIITLQYSSTEYYSLVKNI
jgi:hypothetical protein